VYETFASPSLFWSALEWANSVVVLSSARRQGGKGQCYSSTVALLTHGGGAVSRLIHHEQMKGQSYSSTTTTAQISPLLFSSFSYNFICSLSLFIILVSHDFLCLKVGARNGHRP